VEVEVALPHLSAAAWYLTSDPTNEQGTAMKANRLFEYARLRAGKAHHSNM
jgi:hypothetical protein